jgi:hypothetical protein
MQHVNSEMIETVADGSHTLSTQFVVLLDLQIQAYVESAITVTCKHLYHHSLPKKLADFH